MPVRAVLSAVPLLKTTDPALTVSHAAADPGFARAQRTVLRRQRREQGVLREALQVPRPQGRCHCLAGVSPD